MYDYNWKFFNQHHFAQLKRMLEYPENKIDFSTAIGFVRLGGINVNIGPEHLETDNTIVAGFSMFTPHDSMSFNNPCGQELDGYPYDYIAQTFFSLTKNELENMKYNEFTKTVENILDESIKQDSNLDLYAATTTDFWNRYDALKMTRKISNREALSKLQKKANKIDLT